MERFLRRFGAVFAGVAVASSMLVNSPAWAYRQWVIQTSPNADGASYLYGVSCVSARYCKAVGQGGAGTLVESWNGTAWNIQTSPNPGGDAVLNAVSCVSTTACIAVGYFPGTSGVWQTLVESWNGHTWAVVPSPDPSIGNNYLYGVSCISAAFCKAVGYTASDTTLIESWNGSTWTVDTSPNKGTGPNELQGVSCTSATSCVAVGTYPGASASRTLIEVWNGTAWSIAATPNKGTSTNNNLLEGVSCKPTSSTSGAWCMAVGYNGGSPQTLTERWNGSSWSTVPSPNTGNSSLLNAVSCISATACIAVGAYGAGGTTSTLVESWNGIRWSIQLSPTPGPGSDLTAVSCVTVCTAVGYYQQDSQWSTLVERN